jgi:hypothetical protein
MAEQPHFDDERTLLRARPVVPLEHVDVRVKRRRRWFLGGAFAVAMFLGAASALVSAYFKLRNVPDPEIQPEVQLSVLPVPSVPEPTPEVPVVAVVPERPKPRPRTTDRIRNRDNTDYTRMSEDDALHRIRDSVLIDEWQERRARRVERRERRRAQHHDRDLSNINEIFEGTRRP